ncbi:MAG: type II toxin-antitoxin system Phd/YefM family antitoxin [Bacteroidetes bacterium]|nr:type II toxin-antitoxin system Phd/YefM family antitoxin [Bacteroidota bacterium]
MAQTITANELKTKGVSILEKETSGDTEVIVAVRGKNKYVVLPMEKYNYLRECELEAALLETKRDIKEGKFVKESVDEHIRRITRGWTNLHRQLFETRKAFS